MRGSKIFSEAKHQQTAALHRQTAWRASNKPSGGGVNIEAHASKQTSADTINNDGDNQRRQLHRCGARRCHRSMAKETANISMRNSKPKRHHGRLSARQPAIKRRHLGMLKA